MSLIPLVALWGLIIGSFLGQLADRLPKNQPIFNLKERSRCPHCKKKIKTQDLIPLLSFFLLKGRCRSCHKKISWHYPAVEFLAALISVYWYWNSGSLSEFLLQSLFWYGLLLIAAIDWRGQIVFMHTIWLSGLLAMTISVVHQEPASHLWAALVAASIFMAVSFLGKIYYRQEALGQGDVYIAMVAGMYLGLPLAMLSFYIALLLGGAMAVYLIFVKKAKSKTAIAFGPFMITGIAVVQVFGDTMLKWYWG